MTSSAATQTYQPPVRSWMAARGGLPLAPFSRRAIAIAIDFVLVGVLFLALFVGVPIVLMSTGLLTLEKDIHLHFNFFENWYSIAALVVYFSLATYVGKGQTIGKRLCGIRVISLVHEHLGFWHSVERALGYGASALEGGFGFLQYFLRPDRQTVHDRIAETIVVVSPRRKKAR